MLSRNSPKSFSNMRWANKSLLKRTNRLSTASSGNIDGNRESLELDHLRLIWMTTMEPTRIFGEARVPTQDHWTVGCGL